MGLIRSFRKIILAPNTESEEQIDVGDTQLAHDATLERYV